MGIVEAVDAAPLGSVQCETVFDSVWASLSPLDLAGYEFHRIGFGESEFVAVKAQERFEFVIRTARHPIPSTTYNIIS